jgi:hypothetical protein
MDQELPHDLSLQAHVVLLSLIWQGSKVHGHNPLFIPLFLQLNLLVLTSKSHFHLQLILVQEHVIVLHLQVIPLQEQMFF